MKPDYYARRVADSITGTLAYYDMEQKCRYANHAFVMARLSAFNCSHGFPDKSAYRGHL